MTVAGGTDLGRIRRNNEDAFLIADLSAQETTPNPPATVSLSVGDLGILLAVSDGMGGERSGEVASALALDALRQTTSAALARLAPDAALKAAVESANREVADAAAASPERSGMGATLTACLVYGGVAHVAEVGDSRAYLLRRGRLVQLTRDQSFVQLLVDSGGLTPQAAGESMLRNVILQAIGKTPEITVAMSRLELRRGDRLLLCTDGLTSMVADDELATIVSDPPSLDVGCARLIARAIGQGGRDNVTVILADVSGPEVPEAREDGELSDTFREDTTPQGPKC